MKKILIIISLSLLSGCSSETQEEKNLRYCGDENVSYTTHSEPQYFIPMIVGDVTIMQPVYRTIIRCNTN